MEPELPFDAEPEPEAGPRAVRSPRVRRRLATAQETALRRRRRLTQGLLVFSVVLMVSALVGENGYLETLSAEHEYDQTVRALDEMERENAALTEEIYLLEHDPAALEEAARRHLNLVRPGDTLIILKPARPAGRAPANR